MAELLHCLQIPRDMKDPDGDYSGSCAATEESRTKGSAPFIANAQARLFLLGNKSSVDSHTVSL